MPGKVAERFDMSALNCLDRQRLRQMIRTVIWQDQKRLPYLREMAAKLAGPADAFARFLVEPTLTRDSFVAEFVGEKPRPCTAAQWRYFLEEVQGIVRVALENRELKVGPENF